MILRTIAEQARVGRKLLCNRINEQLAIYSSKSLSSFGNEQRVFQTNGPRSTAAGHPSLSAWFNNWHQAFSKVPKGFEKFSKGDPTPGDDGPSKKPADSKPPGDDKGRGNSKLGIWRSVVAFMLLTSFFETIRRFRKKNEGLAGLFDKEISLHHFLTRLVSRGYVERVQIFNKEFVRVHLRSDAPKDIAVPNDGRYYFRIVSPEAFEQKLEGYQQSLGLHPAAFIPVVYSNHVDVISEALSYLPALALLIVSFALMQRVIANGVKDYPGRFLRVTKAPTAGAKDIKKKIFFKDIAGMKEAKAEVMEFVDFLKCPRKYERLGARIPKGALLVGPPGTGKTLLAKAVAGEANVPFFSMSGSDFLEMFVGVGPSRVRDLFAQARKAAPSIVFIDEIDAVGRKRARGRMASGSNDERENTLNAMLVEMDGFSSGTNVVVLAGTNRPDILDPALTRPGRFDRTIKIEKPDLEERKEIFAIHAKNLKLAATLVPAEVHKRLAALTPGFAGADISNVCNESAIHAARRNAQAIEMKDFESACERVMAGVKKSTGFINRELRKMVAFHEAGHAVAGWFLQYADPVLKVSIVPRTNGALGFAQNLPDEVQLLPKEHILDKIAVLLGGRISEELNIGQITTGASDDLKKVTRLAYAFVSVWGFNDKLGLVSFQNSSDEANYYRPYSESLAQVIDEEARELLQGQYSRVKSLLSEKAVRETITFKDLQEVLGPRPYDLKEEYKQYVEACPTREELEDSSDPQVTEPVAESLG